MNADKVAIVSVVGAFRTGKSFLLDFMVRYLNYSEKGLHFIVVDLCIACFFFCFLFFVLIRNFMVWWLGI